MKMKYPFKTPILYAEVRLESDSHKEKVLGVFDTGSTISIISQDVVDAFHLEKVGSRQVDTMAGSDILEEYEITIVVDNHKFDRRVLKGETRYPNAKVLVGMDILSEGDLQVINSSGKTKLIFEINHEES